MFSILEWNLWYFHSNAFLILFHFWSNRCFHPCSPTATTFDGFLIVLISLEPTYDKFWNYSRILEWAGLYAWIPFPSLGTFLRLHLLCWVYTWEFSCQKIHFMFPKPQMNSLCSSLCWKFVSKKPLLFRINYRTFKKCIHSNLR